MQTFFDGFVIGVCVTILTVIIIYNIWKAKSQPKKPPLKFDPLFEDDLK